NRRGHTAAGGSAPRALEKGAADDRSRQAGRGAIPASASACASGARQAPAGGAAAGPPGGARGALPPPLWLSRLAARAAPRGARQIAQQPRVGSVADAGDAKRALLVSYR